MKKSRDIEIQDEFRTKKVMTMHELCQLVKQTPRTVQRRLKSWGAISSYNKNGRYYVLPDIPKFDKYGIWRYQNCYFSKNITLKKTFIYLVEISDAGLSGQELGKILGLDQRSFLSHFRDSEQVHREKFNDRYIYFSSKKSKYEKQKRRRQRLELRLDLPTDAEAVMILVEYIKYPKIKVEEISERLKQIGIEISFKKIDNLFEYHNIKKN